MRHETNPRTTSVVQGADGYAEAAAGAFPGVSAADVAERLRGRVRGPNAEIVDVVTAMLADPWVAHVLKCDAAAS